MTIPVMQFPTAQPQSQDSLSSGLLKGLQVYSGLLKAFNMPSQMQQQKELGTANLQQKQAQTGLTTAQTGLAQAQTEKLGKPQFQSNIGKSMADYQNIVDTYGEDSPEAKQAYDMLNSSVIRDQAMAASRNAYAQGFGSMMSPKTVREQRINSYMQQGYSLDQAVQLASDQAKKESIMPEGMTPESQMQSSQIQSEIQKNILPTDVQKRQYAGARAGMTLDSLNNFIDQGALNYSGLAGKGKLHTDELMASLTGNVPPQLSAYRNFQGQLNVLKDEYATTLGVPADQISRGELGSLFDVNQYSTNPKAAREQLKNVSDLLGKTEDINFKNLHDLAAKNRDIAGEHEKKDSLQANPQQLKKATPAESKSLGLSQQQSPNTMQMPTFNSKEAFQSWYAQQPPEAQAQIKAQLGGQ